MTVPRPPLSRPGRRGSRGAAPGKGGAGAGVRKGVLCCARRAGALSRASALRGGPLLAPARSPPPQSRLQLQGRAVDPEDPSAKGVVSLAVPPPAAPTLSAGECHRSPDTGPGREVGEGSVLPPPPRTSLLWPVPSTWQFSAPKYPAGSFRDILVGSVAVAGSHECPRPHPQLVRSPFYNASSCALGTPTAACSARGSPSRGREG